MPPSLLEVASSKGFVATSFFSAYPVKHVNRPGAAPVGGRRYLVAHVCLVRSSRESGAAQVRVARIVEAIRRWCCGVATASIA